MLLHNFGFFFIVNTKYAIVNHWLKGGQKVEELKEKEAWETPNLIELDVGGTKGGVIANGVESSNGTLS